MSVGHDDLPDRVRGDAELCQLLAQDRPHRARAAFDNRPTAAALEQVQRIQVGAQHPQIVDNLDGGIFDQHDSAPCCLGDELRRPGFRFRGVDATIQAAAGPRKLHSGRRSLSVTASRWFFQGPSGRRQKRRCTAGPEALGPICPAFRTPVAAASGYAPRRRRSSPAFRRWRPFPRSA